MSRDEDEREAARRALSDPYDDAAWSAWRTGLSRDDPPRTAALRALVKAARRYATSDARVERLRRLVRAAPAAIVAGALGHRDARLDELVVFAAGVHNSRARRFRRAFLRLVRLSAAGERVGPNAVLKALGIDDRKEHRRDKAVLLLAFKVGLDAAARSKRKPAAPGLKTLVDRARERGLSGMPGFNPSLAGRRAAAAYRGRYGADPPRAPTRDPATGREILVFAYGQEDMDLVDAAVEEEHSRAEQAVNEREGRRVPAPSDFFASGESGGAAGGGLGSTDAVVAGGNVAPGQPTPAPQDILDALDALDALDDALDDLVDRGGDD